MGVRLFKLDARSFPATESGLQDPAIAALLREGWRPLFVPSVWEEGQPETNDSRPAVALALFPPEPAQPASLPWLSRNSSALLVIGFLLVTLVGCGAMIAALVGGGG